MALELVSSEVSQSVVPPDVILTCEWLYEGRRCYSCLLLRPETLHDEQFWSDLEIKVARWYVRNKPKNGEIACLPTFQSTLKPSTPSPAQ